jgi:hypothetical protein
MGRGKKKKSEEEIVEESESKNKQEFAASGTLPIAGLGSAEDKRKFALTGVVGSIAPGFGSEEGVTHGRKDSSLITASSFSNVQIEEATSKSSESKALVSLIGKGPRIVRPFQRRAQSKADIVLSIQRVPEGD